MDFLKQPQGIITLLIAGLVLLAVFGIYFAIRCAKAANEKKAFAFTNVKAIENIFYKHARRQANRCVVYISIYLDKALTIYSDSAIWRIFNEIKDSFLNAFCDQGGAVAPYEQRNFIAIGGWDVNSAQKIVDKANDLVLACLKQNSLQGIADIKFGYFCSLSGNCSFDDAVERAKKACGSSEDKGKNHIEWNDREIRRNIQMEKGIEKEIDYNRFFLEYQPVVDAKTKKVVAAEVLARLNSDEEGIIMPNDFIAAINTMSLNEKFDYYVFEKVCKWISNDKEKREECLYTVNFSRTTLASDEFVKIIGDAVERYGLKYQIFSVEILEDNEITGERREKIKKNLEVMRARGMRVAIDDFGSGYTSFNDLQTLPVDTIKIDRTIIKNTDTETGLAIFNNIIKTAKDIGIKTVCEGVETSGQESVAVNAGCDMLQGFYYYRPMSVKQFEKLFAEHNS